MKPSNDKNVSAINEARNEFILALLFRNARQVQPHPATHRQQVAWRHRPRFDAAGEADSFPYKDTQ
jgi:hypothetical protein